MNAISRWLAKPLHLFLVLASLIPIGLVTADIAINGMNVPFNDQWLATFDIARATAEGNLQFDQLIRHHNEHRIFFTNVVTVLSTLLTRLDLKLELFITIAVGVGVFALLVAILRRQYPQTLAALLVPASALFFSLRGQHTWQTSFQSQFIFTVFFLLLGLWAMLRPRQDWKHLIFASVCAFCATISLTDGLLAWPLLFIALLLSGYRQRGYVIYWLVASGVVIAWFFTGFEKPFLFDRNNELIGQNIGTVITYVLAYLGAPFAPDSAFAVNQAAIITVIGLILLAANAAYRVYTQRGLSSIVVELVLVGFSVGSGVMAAVGRVAIFVDYGLNQPLAQRYIQHSSLWWIALVTLGVANLYAMRDDVRQRLPGAALALGNVAAFVALAVLYLTAVYNLLGLPAAVDPQGLDCTRTFVVFQDTSDECKRALRVLPEAVLERATWLADQGLSAFSEPVFAVSLAAPPVHLEQSPPALTYRRLTIQGVSTSVLNNAPDYAARYVLPALYLPQPYQTVTFETAAYVSYPGEPPPPENAPDGVTFRWSVVGEDGETLFSDQADFVSGPDAAPLPVSVDLTPFLDAQPLTLVLEVLPLGNPFYDWSMWVDPHLVFRY